MMMMMRDVSLLRDHQVLLVLRRGRDGLSLESRSGLLHSALMYKWPMTAMELLSDLYIDPSVGYNAPIRMACKHGYHDVVEMLLAHPKTDPTADNDEALANACEYGHIECVRLLLRHPGVNPTQPRKSALEAAVYSGHKDIVALLLADDRVNPGLYQSRALATALHHGTEEVSVEIAEMLLKDRRVDLGDQVFTLTCALRRVYRKQWTSM